MLHTHSVLLDFILKELNTKYCSKITQTDIYDGNEITFIQLSSIFFSLSFLCFVWKSNIWVIILLVETKKTKQLYYITKVTFWRFPFQMLLNSFFYICNVITSEFFRNCVFLVFFLLSHSISNKCEMVLLIYICVGSFFRVKVMFISTATTIQINFMRLIQVSISTIAYVYKIDKGYHFQCVLSNNSISHCIFSA